MVHVQNLGLAEASDSTIWNWAVEHRLAIVTKDADFRQRSFLEGFPPKILWIAAGNCSTVAIEHLLRASRPEILRFLDDAEASFLTLR